MPNTVNAVLGQLPPRKIAPNPNPYPNPNPNPRAILLGGNCPDTVSLIFPKQHHQPHITSIEMLKTLFLKHLLIFILYTDNYNISKKV